MLMILSAISKYSNIILAIIAMFLLASLNLVVRPYPMRIHVHFLDFKSIFFLSSLGKCTNGWQPKVLR